MSRETSIPRHKDRPAIPPGASLPPAGRPLGREGAKSREERPWPGCLGKLVRKLEDRNWRIGQFRLDAGMRRILQALRFRSEVKGVGSRNSGRRVPNLTKVLFRRVALGEQLVDPEVGITFLATFPVGMGRGTPAFDDLRPLLGGEEPGRDHAVRPGPRKRREPMGHGRRKPVIQRACADRGRVGPDATITVQKLKPDLIAQRFDWLVGVQHPIQIALGQKPVQGRTIKCMDTPSGVPVRPASREAFAMAGACSQPCNQSIQITFGGYPAPASLTPSPPASAPRPAAQEAGATRTRCPDTSARCGAGPLPP